MTNLAPVRSGFLDYEELRFLWKVPAVARLLAEVSHTGKGAIEPLSVPPERVWALGYFCARPHTDDSGMTYLLPLIAKRSTLYVGREKWALHPGDVVVFNDYITHRTTDEAPCAALIYEAGGERCDEMALQGLREGFEWLRASNGENRL